MFRFVILTLVFSIVVANARRPVTYRSRGGGGSIVFPTTATRQAANSNNLEENIERLLIRASNMSRVSDFLAHMGIKDDGDAIGSRRNRNFADQAVCEPELRTVELDAGNSGESIMFPKCVRVQRCGGCCVSQRMHCVPTKISTRDVRRTSIRIKRSTPESVSQTTQVEVHEECRCMCKIKESDCNPAIHNYENCHCACKNTNEQIACFAQAASKLWDSNECKCKCRRTQHCSTGLVFSHGTCSCQQL